MKIALCDDEQILLSVLENKMRTLLDQLEMDYQLDCFNDGYDLLRHYKNYDVIFLDIDMPIMDGLSTAKLIREKDKQCRLIFLSSFGEFVYKTFEVNAFRYLIKPIEDLELASILEAVTNDLQAAKQRVISIETQDKKYVQLSSDEILYIETLHRGVRVHTMHQSIESTMLMKDVEALLPKDQYYRTHISYLVNLGHIREYGASGIKMTNQHNVLLSRLKASKFKTAFIKFIKSNAP